MKKIFGMFAMAAVAATTLTCCGGGGTDTNDDGPASINKFCGRTIQFNGVGLSGPTAAGTMWAIVDNMTYNNSSSTAEAWFSFGATPSREMRGQLIVEGGTNAAPTVTIHVNDAEQFGQDTGAQGFFADFLPDDLEEGDTVLGTPAPRIDMTYASSSEGQFHVTYTFLTRKDEEEGQNNNNGNNNQGNNNGGQTGTGEPGVVDPDYEMKTMTSPLPGRFYILN